MTVCRDDCVSYWQKRNAAQLTRLRHQLREVQTRDRHFISDADRMRSRIAQMTSQLTSDASHSAAATNWCRQLLSCVLRSFLYTAVRTVYFCVDNSSVDPLESTGNYSAMSNDMKLVHWPLMGGLLHLIQRGGDWARPQPAQAPPRCTKCNSTAINGQCTITVLLCNGLLPIKG